MALAKGSRCKLAVVQELAFGTSVAGTPAFMGIPFRSETMGSQINTFRSEEIRPDRAPASLRGGNSRTGGNIVTDFAIARHFLFMKHMLGSDNGTPVSCVFDKTANTGTAAAHGLKLNDAITVASDANDVPLPLVQGITYYVRDVTANTFKLAAYPGGPVIDLTDDGSGAFTFTPLFPKTVVTPTLLTDGIAVTRGSYYKLTIGGTEYLFLCQIGGTVTTAASLTEIRAGYSQTVAVSCKFYNVGTTAAKQIEKYTFKGGLQYPTVGLNVEKQILGGSDNLYMLFRGVRINSLELQFPQEGIVGSTWNLLGIDVDPADTAAFSSSQEAIGFDPVTGFESYVTFNNGSLNRPIREASLTISNQCDENIFCLGSRYRREIPEGTRALTGRVSMYFEDKTDYDLFINETKFGAKFSFDRNGDYGQFYFPEAKLTGDGTPKVSGQGVMTADYDLTAFKQTDSSGDVQYEACVVTAVTA